MPSVELVIAGFLGIALAASVLSRRMKTPYTVILVVLGVLLASLSLSQYLGVDLLYDRLVGGGLFVGLVLPALLFEAMMNLDAFEFRRFARPSLLLATAGTVIATLVVGILLVFTGVLPPYPAFLFAALISPTDTATVLEIFRRTRVPPGLSTLMETEAAFNDATGVVVFTILLTSFAAVGQSLFAGLGLFTFVLGGGVLVGLGIGWGARQITRIASDPLSQVILTVAAVYGSYALAVALGVSGLVAVAVTGIYFGNAEIKGPVPGATADTLRSFWAVLVFVANSTAFLFVGLSTDISALLAAAIPIATAFVAVMASRFLSVFPILSLERRGGLDFPPKWINVAVLGGMRGALSIVLAATLPASVQGRGLIATMTLGVAFGSIIVQGFLLDRYTRRAFEDKVIE